jgi:AraC-like DNA-binding protein
VTRVYQERPSRLAGGFVWTSTVDVDHTRVLPDGCMDLIWDGESVFVAGPDTSAFLYAGVLGRTLTGLRFAPGFGPRVLGMPASEFADQRVPLSEVRPASEVQELLDHLDGSLHPARVLEVFADRRASRNGDQVVDEVVHRARGGQDVRVIAEAVALSPRQLQRRCHDAFGYGAKMLSRILRMTRALDAARRGTPFADVAATTGYADQAHLSRDVRALAGVTLGQLVEVSGNGANKSTELPSGSSTLA